MAICDFSQGCLSCSGTILDCLRCDRESYILSPNNRGSPVNAFESFNVRIKDDNGSFRCLSDILSDISDKWV